MGVGSGAASGAATGAAFGPWGAAIGGVIGGIGGYLGGRKQGDPNDLSDNPRLRQMRHNLRNNPQAVAAFDRQLASARSASGYGANGETPEMILGQQRREALDQLSQRAQNPNLPTVRNDPSAGINYNRPTVNPRDTRLADQATSMTRNNSAQQKLDALGRHTYKDRPTEQMHGDPLEQIKNFTGDAADIAKQYASGGYPGGGGGSGGGSGLGQALQAAGVSSRDVQAMMERADVSELMSFDPSAAFEKYATGAQGKQIEALNTANTKLTNTAAGKGRLNTGFFDLDAGELGRQINTDFRNDLQTKALDTNQQKLSAITSGSTIRAQDLDALRNLDLDAQMSNQRSSLEASIASANNSMRAQEGNMSNTQRGLDRDADFRLGALGQLGQADDRRFNALTTGRDYMMDDRQRIDDNYESDRGYDFDTFSQYEDQLTGSRDREDDIFSSDRDWLMDADRSRQDNYENDRDYELDAWGQENEGRLRGGQQAREDRNFEYEGTRNAQQDYLDWLSGSSDRQQGATNAQNQINSQNQNSRNQMTGQIIGTGISVLGDYMTNRRRGSTTQQPRTITNNGGLMATGGPQYRSVEPLPVSNVDSRIRTGGLRYADANG